MSVRAADLPLAVGTGAVLAAVGVGLRTVRFHRTRRCLEQLAVPLPGVHARPERIGAMVERLGARIPGARTCLPQALAGWFLLRLAGHEPAVQVGVARNGGRFDAHAWTECGDRVVVGLRPGRNFIELRGGQNVSGS